MSGITQRLSVSLAAFPARKETQQLVQNLPQLHTKWALKRHAALRRSLGPRVWESEREAPAQRDPLLLWTFIIPGQQTELNLSY